MHSALANIYLIGYRCSGKSTVGRALADHRGLAFYDTDELITAGEQKTITEIVAARGWPHFRKLEKQYLQRVAAEKSKVVATGGGIVLHPGNITCMRSSGTVIWLRVKPQTVLRRLSADPATESFRPALTRQAVEKEVLTTMAARRELYSQAADLSFKTDRVRPAEIVAEIQKAIG